MVAKTARMQSTIKIIVCIFFVFVLFTPSWAATIISPAEDAQVDAGSWITVVVKPEPGEQWQGFILGFEPLEYDPLNNTYKITTHVPNDILGYRDDLIIFGININQKEVWLSRRIFVKLPPDVALQSILIYPNPIFLEKLTPDSSPDKISSYGTEDLSVKGVYSDGVKRRLSASITGTTYKSSNENIVTVSPEGKAVAAGVGKATITVRNGTLSMDVEVIVDSYKNQKRKY